ncbi:XRE family transcriptional regulator [Ilumatobacter sp. SYSU D60003]|uniref:helix-turn-helix domain-containing protein n=1 Tax=Desertimonas flava TaxID=2064846 RepID=UPI001D0C1450
MGAAIRARRQSAGLSATALAERAGVSQPYISQLESGKASPSINTLYRVANALGVTPQDLLPDGDDTTVVIRAGQGAARPIEDRPDAALARFLVGSPDSILQIQEVTVDPDQDLGGYFDHDGEEFVHVLDGAISVRLQGRSPIDLGHGDAVWYQATTPHQWVRTGDSPARLLVVSAAVPRPRTHG